MKQTTGPVPTAAICINKSRLKVYNKENDPTFYLQSGDSFQIELHNPTLDVVLAKIFLNGKQISQGGLVLKPGERVFLERYLDVAKRFKFDTYEVNDTKENQKAIESNGDFKVEFYKEVVPLYNPLPIYINTVRTLVPNDNILYNSNYYNSTLNLTGTNTLSRGTGSFTTNIAGSNTTYNTSNSTFTSSIGSYATTDSFGGINAMNQEPRKRSAAKLKTLKTVETGRVEAGSNSNQKLETVSKSFEYFPFHSTEYKLLPVSQKINTSEDLNVKRYCTKCGHKVGKTDNFCSSCGNKN